mmetsp:Transcript_4190/g.9820  ORF Transcript_4190/g.9820 Transcript_4190/m.9820 type:complete len:220 (+) Transcript_4190:214-873(+)
MSPKRIDLFNREIAALSAKLAEAITTHEEATNSKHTLQIVEWESAGGDEWPISEGMPDGEGKGRGSTDKANPFISYAESQWLKGVAVTGVSDSRVNLRVVTFFTMQAVAKIRSGEKEARLVRFTKRFSEFVNMHKDVVEWYVQNCPHLKGSLPEPPPKNSMAVFKKRTSNFLNNRKADLEKYINALSRVENMKKCKPFLEFISISSTSPPLTLAENASS